MNLGKKFLKKKSRVNLNKFLKFSQKIRNQDNIPSNEMWPIDKLYSVLKDEAGGFLIIFNIHSCLGLKVDSSSDDIFTITYRDPFHANFKTVDYDTKTKKLVTDKDFKIQWFGTFKVLKERGINPSFSTLVKYNYKVHLPVGHEMIIQTDDFRCGDVCAYLAINSKISMFNEDIFLK